MTTDDRATVDGEERRAWRISGRVQGVGFRWSTARKAEELGVAGAVWNRADGQVEVHASGRTEALRAFERWLGRGPSSARVSGVESIEPGAEADRTDFRILR